MLSAVSVRGEISNLKYHTSGHIYFSLKDEGAVIACVCFASNARTLKFRLEEGMKIVATGSVTVYEKSGSYQLYVRKAEPEGIGDLAERFEKLKKDLEERGLFAPEYKQAFPYHVKTLGVVTAPTGAAVRDIINISKRRNPYVQIILYPAIVQGEYAVQSIVRGIRALEAYGVDAMIVGRGGGSIEDLWAFNEEAVAQAIFDCSIPIISAVGHETDTTIADYVADLRAPTPSAAAELAVCDISEIIDKINESGRRLEYAMGNVCRRDRAALGHYDDLLTRSMMHMIGEKKHMRDELMLRLDQVSPENRLKSSRERAAAMRQSLDLLMGSILSGKKNRLSSYAVSVKPSFERVLKNKIHRYELCSERLRALSPQARLEGGYGFISDNNNKVVKSIDDTEVGSKINVRLKDGILETVVESVTGVDVN